MKCFKCGAVMANGQVICSVCDADNSKYVYDNNYSQSIKQVSYNYEKNEEVKEEQQQDIDKDEKISNGGKLFSIVVILLVFVIIVLGLKCFSNYLNKKENEVHNDEIMVLYNKMVSDISVKKALGENIVCDLNCSEYYDYDNDKYSLSISEDDENYIIMLIDNTNEIDPSICDADTNCTNNSVSGKLEK